MMDWSGKAALVTGGGSGIGKHLCITLAEKGCRVTVRAQPSVYRPAMY